MYFDMGIISGNGRSTLGIEIDGRHLAETAQGFLDSRGKDLPDGHLILKLDLGLRGMDVHVDGLRLYSETQEVVGLLALGNQLLIGRHHRFMEIGVTHVSPVDEQELQRVTLAGILGFADVTLHLDQRCVDVHRQQLLVDIVTHEGRNALAESAGHQLIHHVIVVNQGKLHLIVDQRQLFELLDDIAQLHLIALEELATGRNVKKEVLDHEITARRAHVRFLTLTLRCIDDQAGTQLGILATGTQFHL